MRGQYGGEVRNEIPPTVTEEMPAPGGQKIPIQEWWLRLARSLVANDSRDYVTLGADLAKHIDKKPAFDKGTLSRFVKGTGPVTFQLIQALCSEFSRLPMPMFFPSGYEEAVQMQALHERYARMVGVNDEVDAIVTPLKRPDQDGRRRGKRQAAAGK